MNKEQKSLIGITSPDFSLTTKMNFTPSIHDELNVQMKELSLKIIEDYKSAFQVFVHIQGDSFSKLIQEFKEELSDNLDALLVNFSHLPPGYLRTK